jgi:low affinity Fe/Cu permease
LTLARVGIGTIFSVVTTIVAAFFGGVGAFFGYLLQIIVCMVMPLLLLDRI